MLCPIKDIYQPLPRALRTAVLIRALSFIFGCGLNRVILIGADGVTGVLLLSFAMTNSLIKLMDCR
jgi:hypothetical protein